MFEMSRREQGDDAAEPLMSTNSMTGSRITKCDEARGRRSFWTRETHDATTHKAKSSNASENTNFIREIKMMLWQVEVRRSTTRTTDKRYAAAPRTRVPS